MKRIKQILSLLVAFVMIFTIAFPVLKSNAAVGSSIVIHKIGIKDTTGWPSKEGKNGEKYTGKEIQDITAYFGEGAKPVKGAKFYVYKVNDPQIFEKLTPEKFPTKEAVEEANKAEGEFNGAFIKMGQNGDTTDEKGEITLTSIGPGRFWIVEDPSVPVNDGSTVGQALAVPMKVFLPEFDETGRNDYYVHVYPKNTIIDQPTTEKKQKNGNEYTKDRISKNIGDTVEYSIETTMKPNVQYKTAAWTDKMSKGLTFNFDSMKVYKGSIDEGNLVPAESYDYFQEGNGFTLALKEEYLKDNVNGKDSDTKFFLTYNATLNKEAIVDKPETNSAKFIFGNSPFKGKPPVPVSPTPEGKLVLTKKGNNKDNDTLRPLSFDRNKVKEVSFTLYDAETKEVVGEPDQKLNHRSAKLTWNGLDPNKKYIVVETDKAGYMSEYVSEEAGKITVNNYFNHNPKPNEPDSIEVVTGGKKFQKVGEGNDAEGLKDAVFVIKSESGENKGKYLKKKTEKQDRLDQSEYAAKEVEYKEAVKNSLDTVAALKEERDNLYKKAQSDWTWVDEQRQGTQFVASEKGYFKVSGLAYGNYSLEEISAPRGYVLNRDPQNFEVKANSAEDDQTLTIQNRKENILIPDTGGIGTIIFIVIGIALMGGAILGLRKKEEA